MAASRASVKALKPQKGLILVVLVIIIVLAFASYTLSGLSVSQVKVDRDKQTQISLKKAKQAVINYAITYADRSVGNRYGVMPNPETLFNGNDGNMVGSTIGRYVNVVEWLPWRSLDIENIKGDSGNCLFYAVTGSYKIGTPADMMNEDSFGMFRVRNAADEIVQGSNVEDQIVALVIAPGEALPGQTRNPTVATSSCGRDYTNVTAYLEGNGTYDNGTLLTSADSVDDFIHATTTSDTEAQPYNDKFLTISRDEIWDPIVNRSDFKQTMRNLTQGLAMCLSAYANLADNTGRRLPWPAKTDLGLATYDRKKYRNNPNYDDDDGASQGYSGRFPYSIDDSNDAINSAALTVDEILNIPGLCDDLDLGGGVRINLSKTASPTPLVLDYDEFWNNWKDHYFYMVSKVYEPDNSGTKKVCADASTTCIRVNGTEYAGAVIFSGSRRGGVTRVDKRLIAEYLEDAKDLSFNTEQADKTGDGAYVYTNPDAVPDVANDIMYCIQDQPVASPLDVTECNF